MCVSQARAMQISCFVYTVMFTSALVVTGVLHSVWSELSHLGSTLLYSQACGHTVFINHVLYSICLVHAVTPTSHNISAILTYTSYLIHSC